MQRVRIGITGLAVVFLIVLLAAVVVRFGAKDPVDQTNPAPANGNSSIKAPADPLAELGVAPGGAQSDPDPTRHNGSGH